MPVAKATATEPITKEPAAALVTETDVEQVTEAITEKVPETATKENAVETVTKENATAQAAETEAEQVNEIVAEQSEIFVEKVTEKAKIVATEDAAAVEFDKTILEEPDTEEDMSLSALKKKKFAKPVVAAGSSKRKSRAVKPKKSRRVVTRRVVKAKLADTDEDDSNAEMDY